MKKLYILVLLLTLGLAKVYSQEAYLGEIRIFAGSFAPTGWALCDGQLLPIAQNAALFSLLGTTYGGNGTVNFALPDLRGRTAMGVGNGHVEGERGGEETHILTLAELPTHTHALINMLITGKGNSAAGDKDSPAANYYAKNPARGNEFNTQSNAQGANIVLSVGTINNIGGGQSHNNMAPYTTLSFIIAIEGFFPSPN